MASLVDPHELRHARTTWARYLVLRDTRGVPAGIVSASYEDVPHEYRTGRDRADAASLAVGRHPLELAGIADQVLADIGA